MSVIINTAYGAVSGFSADHINKWFGIPYAKAPVGNLRFQKPMPPDTWDGVREATSFSPKCPQLSIPVNADNGLAQSEDCLYLNIWAPENARNCPVLFWIYGGSFAAGEGSDCIYDGTSFAANGNVVVVTFNYRVGLFGGFYNLGFCHSLEGKYTENVGIYDCIAALRWVNENISVFGGDPQRITVAGESAGATITALLLHRPEINGLYHQAILESVADLPFTDKSDTYMAQSILDAMGLTSETAEKLCTMPEAEIMSHLKKMTGNNALLSGASCIVDKDLIQGSMRHILDNQEASDVSMLIGTNHDEGVIFVDPSENWGKQEELVMKKMLQADDLNDSDKTFSHYFPLSDPSERAKAYTDRMFCLPSKTLLDKQCRKTAVYAYRFDYAPPEARAMGMNAFHSAEMIYVFHNLPYNESESNSETKQDAEHVSKQMHTAWIRFIQDGNPGWKAYDTKNAAFSVFDAECKVDCGYAKEVKEIWQ